MQNLKTAKRKGQSMLETVVAMSVLITGITTLMSLVVMTSTGRRSSEFQTVAASLAREGIEMAVAKRNDNWINGNAFDTGLYSGTDYTFDPAFNPSTLAWTFDFTPNAISDALAKIYTYNSGANLGLMVQGTSSTPQPASTVYSGYDRIIAADPICYNGTAESVVTSGSTCSGSPGKIGVRVTSTVRWSEHNGTHSLSAIESIYDWR